ncbi:MAG: hypothetical protein M1833_002658 [Piccolia ochrophora]|nr:MAG: hypothetical protein M1833_002658 [Piccolia ochrophora]
MVQRRLSYAFDHYDWPGHRDSDYVELHSMPNQLSPSRHHSLSGETQSSPIQDEYLALPPPTHRRLSCFPPTATTFASRRMSRRHSAPRCSSYQSFRQQQPPKKWAYTTLPHRLRAFLAIQVAAVVDMWTRHVDIIVPLAESRDHSALERTFLAYVRTGLSLSMAGTIIAQIYILQHGLPPTAAPVPPTPDQPDPPIRDPRSYQSPIDLIGKPLAASCQAAAIGVSMLGALRFWRQQNAILRGKVWAGGFELDVIGITFALVSASGHFDDVQFSSNVPGANRCVSDARGL